MLDLPSHYQSPLRRAITTAYRMDETEALKNLIPHATYASDDLRAIQATATHLVEAIRKQNQGKSGIDSFMAEYNLNSDEGIALMCLAEAMLRIPDKFTIDKLIRDKITSADWQAHLGQSSSFYVNAATWGLMLTGKVLEPYPKAETASRLKNSFKRLIERTGEPVIRKAVGQAMKIMSRQFVMGRTIEEAQQRALDNEKKGYRYSYDMLGEAAYTAADAERYFQAYLKAIAQIGVQSKGASIEASPSISVKLSALHPRYELAQHARVIREMAPKVLVLAEAAKQAAIGFTIDAEEAARLDISLDIFEVLARAPSLQGWNGLGLAVQAYQKRTWYTLDWLADLAKNTGHKFNVRLVKGAYWDTEIKISQQLGLSDYPVFTRKTSTDISYLACARKLMGLSNFIYPQFATHNAFTVAAIIHLMGERRDFEFQCLHGMGQALYEEIVPRDKAGIPCRIYAPVGSHEDLLPYLVRRLLENGANTSFVHRIVDANSPISDLIADPVTTLRGYDAFPHPRVPKPSDIFGDTRRNSAGVDLSNTDELNELTTAVQQAISEAWRAGPIINGKEHTQQAVAVHSPIDRTRVIGHVQLMEAEDIERALQAASSAQARWNRCAIGTRAAVLLRAAELFEKHRNDFIALAVLEAGKTINDAVAEVREAVDFLRYYAEEGQRIFHLHYLKGYTGEENSLHLENRGVILCVSPWNFPLAIFTGQVSAALVTGNCVLAKPAAQTPMIAALAVRLLHAAGIPADVLQLLIGPGKLIGATALIDPRVNGVIFTGSTETARVMNLALANRPGPILPFIAETGGQNAMIVDSSALAEQVVRDVLTSAFGSAGQRCSALRVLYLQDEVAEGIITMLRGAMAELVVGDPQWLSTDIGPVIDAAAKNTLEKHLEFLEQQGTRVYRCELPASSEAGTFVAPTVYEIPSLSVLPGEVFGPILHIIRYRADALEQVIADINATGYGLTLGVHSRVSETVDYILQRVRVGNCYVNRSQIGAVVGLQPFGGEGLSGTGPKAGGPNYLPRLCTERAISINTTAAGGNTDLMMLGD
jgi:RHH-type proline utilization regulon transcriptional repressor/proline dehydrogenase/delta 1-pyrroline-5-carboxylate dehydrogenase